MPRWLRASVFVLLGAGFLLLPAVYNGFPLTFWDTRAYVEHAWTLMPRPDRVIGYSLFIRAFSLGFTLWLVAAAQCVLVSVLMWRFVTVVSGRAHPGRHLVTMAVLTVATALPWISGQIMADVFTPVLVIALYLLLEVASLGRGERWALLVLSAVCVTVHLSHLYLGAGLLFAAAVFYRARKEPRVWTRVRAPAGALLAGAVFMSAFNYARSGNSSLASGADAFILAHLIESGVAEKELTAHCPERDYWLCPYRAQFPMKGDEFLWVDKLHVQPWERHEEVMKEARRLFNDSLRDEPVMQAQLAVYYTKKAFFAFGTGEGFDADAESLIEEQLAHYLPGDVRAFRGSRQQTSTLPLSTIRAVNWTLSYALLAAAVATLAYALFFEQPRFQRASTRLLLFIFVALFFNAVLCGNLSGIHDRYQSRVLWLVALGLLARYCEFKDGAVRPAPVA
jgi:hypothetical protein